MKQYLILLDGSKGAGKSTLSELLEQNLSHTEFFSIDKERKLLKRTGSITDDNEQAFQIILNKLEIAFVQNMNVVIDCGVTQKRLEVIEAFVKKHDVSLYKFFLTAPYNILRSRVEKRDSERGTVFDVERFDMIYNALKAKSFDDFCMIDSNTLSPQEIFEMVHSKII